MPTNNQANEVNSIIGAGVGTIENITEQYCIAQAPFLGLPVVKQIFEYFLDFIMGNASKAFQTGATFLVIDHQVNSEQKDLSAALDALNAAHATGDAVKIKSALDAYVKAASNLTHNDGSAVIK